MMGPTAKAASPAPRLAPEVLAERREDEAWEQRIRVPPDLACWPGHFAQQAVVPGVLQVHWAMAVVARWLGAPPEVQRIEALKFKQLLLPGQELTLRVARGRGDGRIHFVLADGDQIFASGRVVTGSAGDAESGDAP